jgi:hypothetical protein
MRRPATGWIAPVRPSGNNNRSSSTLQWQCRSAAQPIARLIRWPAARYQSAAANAESQSGPTTPVPYVPLFSSTPQAVS